MKKNIYKTQSGINIDLNNFDEVDAHLDELTEDDWVSISMQKLSEPFIEKYADKVNWCCISKYQTLSEPFIEKYANKVDWYKIYRNQKLSEPFIEKYADKVDWEWISQYQNLSDKFIGKHIDKLATDSLFL